MPFSQLEKTNNFAYIAKVMELVKRYHFTPEDSHMSDSGSTIHIARLLKLVASRSIQEINLQKKKYTELEQSKKEAVSNYEKKLELQHKEITRLRNLEEKSPLSHGSSTKEDPTLVSELRALKDENNNLAIELKKLSVENEELRQFTRVRKEDRDEVNDYNSKILMEFKHLVAKHNRLTEKSKHTEELLQEFRAREKAREQSEDSELAHLREKVENLLVENRNLITSRDRAEELCEHRETQALRDLAELREEMKNIVEAEVEKYNHLKAKYDNYVEANESHLGELIQQHQADLAKKDELLAAVQMNVRTPQKLLEESSESSDSNSAEEPMQRFSGDTSNQHRLQRENYDLSQEIEQLEIRLDAAHEENTRLARIVKDYESGNEGLRNLRHSLADGNRSIELLQSENTQLRERLHGLEDSLTFTAALQELCRRIGVTDEEINSLKPTGTQTYSELDTLKDELNILREEVEWLERDRRHWMNKVRLQPLMDTKLRFELGLSPEQLKQLDQLVEQMKEGKIVVEDNDIDYKEKYYSELQLRRKDAMNFNEYVKGRIDNAINAAVAGLVHEGNSNSTASSLRDQLQVITSRDVSHDETVKQLRDELESCKRRLEQSQLTINSQAQEILKTKEELKMARTEKDEFKSECERYKNLVFSHIANEGKSEEVTNRSAGGKWTEIAVALQEQVQAKSDLIEALTKKIASQQETIDENLVKEKSLEREIIAFSRKEQNLNDQLSALQETNEELMIHNTELEKVNKDVLRGIEVEKDEHNSSRELLQKIVLLRKRESALVQRLRRVVKEKENILNGQHQLCASMENTLLSIKDVMEGKSSGFILAPSASRYNAEQEVLGTLSEAVEYLSDGRLYREDSAYVAKLYSIYFAKNNYEQLQELKVKTSQQETEIQHLTAQLDEMTAKLQKETYKGVSSRLEDVEKVETQAAAENTVEYLEAAAKKWEAEATLWKQKYQMGAKHLEVRDQEVAILEAEMNTTREEMVKVQGHIQNLFSQPTVKADKFQLLTSSVSTDNVVGSGGESLPSAAAPQRENRLCGVSASSIQHLEKEVARLKSINFSLLQHSFDMQSTVKSLEAELDGKNQEILLTRSSADGKTVNDFIAAAIQEQTALRRQNELAEVETKKMRVKLAATEANLQVVANEAASYKLGAYRLYRKYVDEMVKVVNYIRGVQRASEGALSPHRAEILDKRYSRVLHDLEEALQKNSSLSSKTIELSSIVKTLEQRLTLAREGLTDEALDKVDRSLREAHSKVRETRRNLEEAKAEASHYLSKSSRMEDHIKNLDEELTRLEFGCISVSPLDESMLRNLLDLKETVFKATQAPPLSFPILPTLGSTEAHTVPRGDDTILAEYKQSVTRQMELIRECKEAREELERCQVREKRQKDDIFELKATIRGLEEYVAHGEQQLEELRSNAEQRETRLIRGHETQSSVANRAVEHTIRCLQGLLKNKEEAIEQLQSQLQLERQKCIEYQSRETVRVMNVTDELMKNNDVTIARFKEAVHGDSVGASPQPGVVESADGGTTAALSERVRTLTGQILTLEQELRISKESNMLLESHIEALVKQRFEAVTGAQLTTGMNAQQSIALNYTAASTSQVVPISNAPTLGDPPGFVPPSAPVQAGGPAKASESPLPEPIIRGQAVSTDALSSMIRNQQVIIDSLRTRESSCLQELALERQRREALENELQKLRLHSVEQGATVTIAMPPTGLSRQSPLEESLRTQIACLEQDLIQARQELVQERMNSEEVYKDAQKWKEYLYSVHAETEKQREELEKARQVASMNTDLQLTVENIRGQNEKLILAASVLKQKLMEEAQRGGTVDRKLQQEVALVQRLGVIQEESSHQVKQLEQKVKAVQKELEDKVVKEQQALKQSEECQKAMIQLQQQLRERENSIAILEKQLKAALASPQSSSPSGAASKPTPYTASHSSPPPIPIMESEVLMKPQVARLISRELRKMQRDNLEEISSLRAIQRRLESELEESREQVRSEREGARSVRAQLLQLKKVKNEIEERFTKEVARLHREIQGQKVPSPSLTEPIAKSATSSHERDSKLASENETLRKRVLELEALLKRTSTGAAGTTQKSTVGTTASSEALSTSQSTKPTEAQNRVPVPTNINQYIASIQSMEAVIDKLQKKTSVDAVTQVNVLEHKLNTQKQVIQLLATELSVQKKLPLTTVQELYGISEAFVPQPKNSLESELLEKRNQIVELKFERDNLHVQVKRLQQHFQELLEDKGLPDHLVPASEVAVLRSLVENLKIVVEAQKQEITALRSCTPSAFTLSNTMEALESARQREVQLQDQLQDATDLLLDIRSHGTRPANVLHQQRDVSAKELEQLFHRESLLHDSSSRGSSLPPTASQNPNVALSSVSSAKHSSLKSLPGQRRLSRSSS